MADQSRYACARCGDFSEQNTAERCSQCGTDADMFPVILSVDPNGMRRMTLDERRMNPHDPRLQHMSDPRRQAPQ